MLPTLAQSNAVDGASPAATAATNAASDDTGTSVAPKNAAAHSPTAPYACTQSTSSGLTASNRPLRRPDGSE